MAKKSKNRPKKLPPGAPLTDDPGAKVRGPGVAFEIEPDAEKIFLESLEEFERRGLSGVHKIISSKCDEAPLLKMSASRQERQQELRSLDLHRQTLEEARRLVDQELRELISRLKPGDKVKLRIVTGKGRHSGPTGPVLPREIHRYVKQNYGRYILQIDESPADLILGELPLRGHFDVLIGL
jgi:DNA-nicking Smr family endonuclease